MTIEALINVLPPPAEPFEAFNGTWELVEAEIGTPLPEDYKAFVRLYGSGYFMEFLGVDVPFTANPNTRFGAAMARAVNRTFYGDDEVVYPLWPQASGLLPFGATDNGDYLFWKTEGAPDSWPVVVWDRGFQEFEVLDCDLTGFLAGLVTGEVAPKAFPDHLLPCDRLFTPRTEVTSHHTLKLVAATGSASALQLTWTIGSHWPGVSTCSIRPGV